MNIIEKKKRVYELVASYSSEIDKLETKIAEINLMKETNKNMLDDIDIEVLDSEINFYRKLQQDLFGECIENCSSLKEM